MGSPGADFADSKGQALEVFSSWLRTRSAKQSFEQLCAAHVALAADLQQLHSVFLLGQATASSASFQKTLHEHFTEAEELVLSLEETAQKAEHSPVERIKERYDVEGEIARGGMGIVWRVRDRDLSRTLAMKVMNLPSAPSGGTGGSSRALLARFIEEAQVTAQLDHPGIVPVHEVGFNSDGQPFFTMKLVKGRALNEVFQWARQTIEGWNLPRAVGALVKACQALGYAHSKGVIHRDLKPANVMVGRFGEVYVMDWGLAKVTGRKDLHDIRPKDASLASGLLETPGRTELQSTPEAPLLTVDGSVVGTPAYMSPEQAKGLIEEVDQASDVYSLGAILYSLLSGQPPYVEPGTSLSPHTILAMVIQSPPRPVRQLNPAAPPELIAICEKAMAREKNRRYPSSLDLAEDLQAFLDHRVVRAYRTGALAELKSWVVRNRMTAAVTAGAITLIMILLGFGAVWERAKAGRLKESLARQYLRRGQAFCEQGEIARGFHWLARSLQEAPQGNINLKETIRQNLAGWRQQWNPPRAMLLQDALITTAAFAPDNQRVFTGTTRGMGQLWSAETGESFGPPLVHDGPVRRAFFSPDSNRLLTYADNGVFRLWNAGTGEQLGRLATNATAIVFIPNSDRLYVADRSPSVRSWSSRDGQPQPQPVIQEAGVSVMAVSSDGRWLATARPDGAVKIWDARTGAPHLGAIGSPGPISMMGFSPESARLVIARENRVIRLWSTATGEPVGVPMFHERLTALAFSPDGRRLVTGGLDHVARLWNATNGTPVGSPMLHASQLTDARFVLEGRLLQTAGPDGVRFWSADSAEPVGQLLRQAYPTDWIYLRPDGRVALSGHDRALALWAVQPPGASPLPFPQYAHVFALTPDGRRAFVGTRGSNLSSCALDSGQAASLPIHEEDLWDIVLSPDGQHLLTCSGNQKRAQLWALSPEQRVLWTVSHHGDVRTGAFSPDGKLLATGSFDGTARVWKAESGQPVGSPLVHSNLVEDVAFSPDGTLLATAAGDGGLRVWAVATGRSVGPVLRHRDSVLAVKFSPDGKLLATGSRDWTARFWHVHPGRPMGVVLEHRAAVEDVCFSPDGRTLATASLDGVRLWSVQTGELAGPLRPLSTAWLVRFTPDGRRLIASSNQHGMMLWELASNSTDALRRPDLWTQVLTWQEMDEQGVVTWLDRSTWELRRAELAKSGASSER